MKRQRTRPLPKFKTQDLLDRQDVREVADVLRITTQAVYAWGEYIPQLRVYELQALRPEWFNMRRQAA
jgi:hypothetical protein